MTSRIISFPSLRLELRQIPPNNHADAGIIPLHIPLEVTEFCPVCQSVQTFVAGAQLANGLLGKCSRCGDERVRPYTRTIGDTEWQELT